jgi:hypothetical protein
LGGIGACFPESRRGAQNPVAAMMAPFRCVPDMSPSLGAPPKVETLPRADTVQYPTPLEVAKMAEAGSRPPTPPVLPRLVASP